MTLLFSGLTYSIYTDWSTPGGSVVLHTPGGHEIRMGSLKLEKLIERLENANDIYIDESRERALEKKRATKNR